MTTLFWIVLAGCSMSINSQDVGSGFSCLHSCSDCVRMSSYVKDADLLKECQTCCIPDAVERVFDSCRLEYDTKYFGDTAEITQFIQAHGAEFPSLKVQHKARMTPKLTLKDASGTESVDVYGWKRDDIHDFLKQKLRSQ